MLRRRRLLPGHRCRQLACLLAAVSPALAPANTSAPFGIPLDQPLAEASVGASRDGAPVDLLLDTAPQLPNGAASASQWQADGHWWYAQPVQLPARLQGRALDLQIAINGQREPFWLHLTSRTDDCTAALRWFHKGLAARYEQATNEVADKPGNDSLTTTETAAVTPRVYQSRDGSGLVGLHCAAQRLQLEYLLPARYQSSYAAIDRQPPSMPAAPVDGTISKTAAKLLAAQSQALLQGTRERLSAYLGITLSADEATNQPPGPAQPLDLSAGGFAYLQDHPLLPGARHTLEADAVGGVLRLQSVIADADRHQHARWLALLRERFGAPAKQTANHQIFRIGPQRLVLRHEAGELRISYQDLARRKQERARLAALADDAFQESIRGL